MEVASCIDNIFYMKQAFKEAEKSKCPRTKVGCVLVKNNSILASAYNSEILNLDRCAIYGCIRNIKGILSGSNLELCRGIHAEQKLIITCSIEGINPKGSIIYITHSPCMTCAKMLLEAGINQLYYSISYPNEGVKSLFDEVGLKYDRVKMED